MKYLILSVSALAMVACGNAETETKMEKAGDVTYDIDQMKRGIEVSSAYIQPPFPGRDVAAGFFELTNHGPDDRLIAVSSPISANVEIHNHIEEDGVMKMRKIEGVALAKGETVKFKPGSFHIMMFGAAMPENAEDVAVTFTYEKAKPVTLILPIGEPEENKMDQSSPGSGSEY